jgi:hypothetical protein
LSSIVNIFDVSCNRNEQLRVAQATKIAEVIEIDEIEREMRLNQIGTLQRIRDIHWSSHLRSVSSLIKIFNSTCDVILKIINGGTTSSQRAKADSIHQAITSFDKLHLNLFSFCIS